MIHIAMKNLCLIILFGAMPLLAFADIIPDPRPEPDPTPVALPSKTSGYTVRLGQPLSDLLWDAVRFQATESLPGKRGGKILEKTYRKGSAAVVCRGSEAAPSCELTFSWARGLSTKDLVPSVVEHGPKAVGPAAKPTAPRISPPISPQPAR